MIGVFDSGLGGLTVLKSLLNTFPDEDFIYLGDTARLPYGSKSGDTIRKYGEQILKFLSSHWQCKALVIACNSASAQFPESTWQGIPLFNVIRPGVENALAATTNKHIGIMATRATINARAYEIALQQRDPNLQISSQACPLLVPLAEEGWVDDPITNLVVYRYLQPLIRDGVDTLIMGCTHYPILEASIRKAVGPAVGLIESGAALAAELGVFLKTQSTASTKTEGAIHLRLTDSNPQSEALARRLLAPFQVESLEWVDLTAEAR